ncbi:MAG: uracil-DNA glycosylase [Alphaproteobacteria bacterium]|nr:uracil-DNA glycosylase [Alphaproteobacteria bacterium]
MEASLNPVQLLQWYMDIGVDEAIGEELIDRTRIVEKPPVISATILPITQVSPPPAPIIGTIEALGEAKVLAAAAKTVEELKAALEGFQGLSLKRTATQIVFADGAPTARVMLVGEVPGADEDRIGRPFAGASGQLLDKMLAAIGLSRENNVYITNVINWRPPGNRTPSEAELALSLPFVQRHIELVNPAVLVYVGGVATKALLQSSQSVMRLRGKWMDYSSEGLQQPIPSLAMFNPTYLIGSPAQKGLAWADLLMLKAKLQELGVL